MIKLMMCALLSVIGIFLIIDAAAATHPSVPVIAWSNTRDLHSVRQISAGEEITKESLKQDFLDKGLGQDQTIVLVLLNKLSLGDLTRYGNAYDADNHGGIIPHIKTSMERSVSSMVLPQTDTSDLVGDLVSKVKAQDGEVTEISDPFQLASLPAHSVRSSLVIVRVEPSGSMEEQLAAADKVVKTATAGLERQQSAGGHTILFTADHASKLPSQPGGRHLLQVAETMSNSSSQYTFINFTSGHCQAFMFAEKITAGLLIQGQTGYNKTIDIQNDKWSEESECISDKSLIFRISCSDLEGPNGTISWLHSLDIVLTFNTTSMNYWVIEESSISYTLAGGPDGIPEEIDLEDGLITPVGWSYHCGDSVLTKRNKTNEKQLVELVLKDFQIQPFAIKDNKFSSANDCIGYFTAPIWMGILTALMIIIIVGFGIAMMANVKVMDKFDDPKGKPLVINVAES